MESRNQTVRALALLYVQIQLTLMGRMDEAAPNHYKNTILPPVSLNQDKKPDRSFQEQPRACLIPAFLKLVAAFVERKGYPAPWYQAIGRDP